MSPDARQSPEPEDATCEYAQPPRGLIPLIAVLHFVCCGLPLLLLSGVSLAFLTPYWPVAAGALAVVGLVGFAWYLKRGCATCPRNEGRRLSRRPPRGPQEDGLTSQRVGSGRPDGGTSGLSAD